MEPIDPPGLNGTEVGEWMKQRSQRKKERRGESNRVKWGGCATQACQSVGGCRESHSSPPREWQARVNKSIQEEKNWIDKYAQVQLVERPDCAPEVNEVPPGNGNGDYETVTVTLDSGAYNTVGPRKVGSYFPVKPTEARKHHRRASTSVLPTGP